MKKISYKIIMVMLFGIIMLLLNYTECNAANAGISSSSGRVSVGDSVNINVSITAATWNLKVSGSGISDTIVGVNTNVENQTTNKSYKLDTSKAGTYTVTLSGDITDADGTSTNISSTATVTVEENANPTPTPQSTPKPTEAEEPEKKEPTFKSVNETVYVKSSQSSVNVRQGYTTDTKLLGALKSGESVTRTGIGDNGWSKVTYNGQTAYIISSALTTEEPEEKEEDEEETSTNKALKELVIEGYELTPKFDPETTRYSITLKDDDEKELDITATPEDEKSKVSITGNGNFENQNNIIRITVTAEDGTTRIYSISVLKENETPTIEMVKLSNLQVANAKLNPTFDPDVTSYVIEVEDPSKITSKDIVATAEDENVEVTIAVENSSSEDGEKKITIMLEDKENNIITTYEIFVKKPVDNQLEGMVKGNTDKTIYYILGTIIIALIILITVVIIILRKTSNKEDDDFESEQDELSDDYDYSLKNAIDEANDEVNDEYEYDDIVKGSRIKSQILNTDYNVFKDSTNDVGVDDMENNEEDDLQNKRRGKHF